MNDIQLKVLQNLTFAGDIRGALCFVSTVQSVTCRVSIDIKFANMTYYVRMILLHAGTGGRRDWRGSVKLAPMTKKIKEKQLK